MCPVCETPNIQNTHSPDTFELQGGHEYLQAVARSSNSRVEDLMLSFDSYLCSHCGAYYLDPWLTTAGRNSVFISGHPIHNAGWRNLQQLVERNLVPSLVISPDEILNTASIHIGAITSYVELGCPFQGLLLHMATEDSLAKWSAKTATSTSMSPTDYRRFLLPLRTYLFWANRISNLARLMTRALRVRDKVRRRWVNRSCPSFIFPPEVFFIPLQSSKFWGLNCSMYGDSCVATSRAALGVETMSYQTFANSNSDQTFDLVGLFNVLDHQDDPLELIRVCLRKAKAIICQGHNLPFARQHHFGLGETFFDHLENTMGHCKVVRLSPKDNINLLYLIISQ